MKHFGLEDGGFLAKVETSSVCFLSSALKIEVFKDARDKIYILGDIDS
jgi:hypothetical protein